MSFRTLNTGAHRVLLGLLATAALTLITIFGMTNNASAAPSSIIDDGSNSSGWTNEVKVKANSGNPGSTFSFDKNTVMTHAYGSSGADFQDSTIKFDIIFNASSDYLGLWWGRGLSGTGIANALYMGPAGNPNTGSSWMRGKIGLSPNTNGPCPYYCLSGNTSSTIEWAVSRWYTVEVKISATSTSYYVDGQLAQTISTVLPAQNIVSFGGDDRNGYGFTDGVYVDNIAITPPPIRTVTYDANSSGSTAPTQGDVMQNDSFTVAGGVVRDLYDFAGWSDGTNVYQPGSNYTVGASNVVLNATWTPKTYALTFDSHGGTSVAPGTFDNVNTFSEPTAPTKSGHTFVGWSKTEAGSVLDSNQIFSETSALTLHAVWASNSVEIHFDPRGGSLVDSMSFEIGTPISSAPSEPTRAGYVFSGWKAELNGSYISFPYSPVLTTGYPLAVSAAGLTDTGTYQNVGRWKSNVWYGPQRPANHPRDVVTYKNGLKYVAIRESINAVVSNPSGPDGYYLIPLDLSASVFATWTAETHTITYVAPTANGAVPVQGDVETAASFTVAVAPSRTGYTFGGWSDGVTIFAAGDTYSVATSDVTLTATWTAVENSVTYLLNGGTSTTPVQGNVASNSNFTLAAAPTRAGFTFAGWFDGTDTFQSGESYSLGVAPVTLTASWTTNPSRSVTFASGGGTGSQPVGPVSVIAGLSFQVPQNTFTRSGFTFSGWSDGANILQPGANYLVGDSDVTLTATWNEAGLAVEATTKNLPGFALDSFVLTRSMKKTLDLVAINTPINTQVTCTGYTMGPRVLKSDKALAANRAKVVCAYLAAKNPSIRGYKLKSVNTTSLSAFARRTVITVKSTLP